MVGSVVAPLHFAGDAALGCAVQGVHHGQQHGGESRRGNRAVFPDPEQEIVLFPHFFSENKENGERFFRPSVLIFPFSFFRIKTEYVFHAACNMKFHGLLRRSRHSVPDEL